MQEIWK